KEGSSGQTWLTGDIFGWFPIAADSTTTDYQLVASLARSAATASGVNLALYNRHVIVVPPAAFPWWGLGTVGGNPSTAWVNGQLLIQVVAHEMGHNFGL